MLDVIDNFFDGDAPVERIPGRRLVEFGEEVRRFAAAWEAPSLSQAEHPTYLGGWPSANVWAAVNSELIMSSLLYSGEVLVHDPVADWFSNERYELPVLLRSRGGYLEDDGTPAMAQTRQFLSVILPGLQRLRPLIEAGAVVLSPFRQFRAANRDDIGLLADSLLAELGADPQTFSRTFDPSDLAVDDNARGLFTFAGGDRDSQIRKALHQSLHYFASEYAFAAAHGANYTTVFRFESFLCEEGLGNLLRHGPSQKVVDAVLRSKLPAFNGLTPEVVARIRDDDSFAAFRAELFNTYRDIPSDVQVDVDRYIAEAEATLLSPKIERMLRDPTRGPLSAVKGVAGFGFRVGASVAVGVATAGASLAAQAAATAGSESLSAVLSRLRGQARAPEPTGTIWRRLADHGKSVETEITGVDVRDGARGDYWGIADEPSMNVTVTNGVLLSDHMPRWPKPARPGGPDDPYGVCPCGSGEKWKFCCSG